MYRLARCEALRVEVDAQKKSVASAEEKLREQQAKGGAGVHAAESQVAVEKDRESSEWRGGGEEGRVGEGELRRSCVSVRLRAVSGWLQWWCGGTPSHEYEFHTFSGEDQFPAVGAHHSHPTSRVFTLSELYDQFLAMEADVHNEMLESITFIVDLRRFCFRAVQIMQVRGGRG